jgi:hypothetical protein
VTEATQIALSKWAAWSKAGVVTIEKSREELSANLAAAVPSETNQLHLTVHEMNKSLQ